MRDETGNEAPASLPNIGVTIALFCYCCSNVHFTAEAVKRVKNYNHSMVGSKQSSLISFSLER